MNQEIGFTEPFINDFRWLRKPKMKLSLRSFFLQGNCLRGDLCSFAHGKEQVETSIVDKDEDVGQAQAWGRRL